MIFYSIDKQAKTHNFQFNIIAGCPFPLWSISTVKKGREERSCLSPGLCAEELTWQDDGWQLGLEGPAKAGAYVESRWTSSEELQISEERVSVSTTKTKTLSCYQSTCVTTLFLSLSLSLFRNAYTAHCVPVESTCHSWCTLSPVDPVTCLSAKMYYDGAMCENKILVVFT